MKDGTVNIRYAEEHTSIVDKVPGRKVIRTVDNDVVPIAQSLGADTAAEQGALFFENVVRL